MKALVAGLVLFGIFTGYYAFKTDWEKTKLQTLNMLQERQIELMRDECREFEYKLSTMPSYEEGYKDALIKRNAGSYADGYADARKIFDSSNNYTAGYHAAVTQFGFLKEIEKDTAAKVDPETAKEGF